MQILSKINKNPTAKDYNDLVKRINILSKIRGANGINVRVGGGGVNIISSSPTTQQIEALVVRRLKVQENAPSDANISCRLVDVDDIIQGDAFDVKCDITDGIALDSAIPRLALDDFISAFKFGDIWHCTTVFQTSEDCT